MSEPSICPHDASETRTDRCLKDPAQSPTSLARLADQNHSACPWPRLPARCADPADDPTLAGWEDRSCLRLQHRQQRAKMTRVESRLHQKAAPLAQANLNRSIRFHRTLLSLAQI